MTIKDLENYLNTVPEQLMEDAADIVAETATEYYKQTFHQKAFDGNPWAPGKPKRRGSLLIDSGALLNSIRPTVITPYRVVIAAGNAKVTYARVHNEGYDGPVAVPAHTRRTKKSGDVPVRAHTRTAHIVQRQFLGDSSELNRTIHDRIEGYIQSELKR